MAAAPPAPAPAPAPAPVSEPPGRVLRRHKTALTHGTSIEEKRVAAGAFAALAEQGKDACELMLSELMTPIVRILCAFDPDEHVASSLLQCVELIATFVSPSEVTEFNVAAPLVMLLDAKHSKLRMRACSCIAVLCEDEHGLAPARLLDAGLVPALVRLAGASRVASAFATLQIAVGVLARLAAETRFARRVVDGDVSGVLLQCGGLLHPDSPTAAKQAQLASLRALGELAGRVSEFKQALSSEPSFFPLLFNLRDSTLPGVSEEAHAIAKHWGEDFFGWAWECCWSCKSVAAKLMLDPVVRPEELEAEMKAASVPPPSLRPKTHQHLGASSSSSMMHPPPMITPLSGAAGSASAASPSAIAPPMPAAALPSPAPPVPAPKGDKAGGSERYREELDVVTEQLRDFLGHADEVARGLLKMQAELDEGSDACERYVRVLRQRNQIAADPVDAVPTDVDVEQPPAEAFAARCRQMGHAIGQIAERVRTSSRALLLHCNLLLDSESALKRAGAHLDELDALVRSSKAVEVSFRWKLEAHATMKKCLCALALRLELYVRALVQQREGSGSLLSTAQMCLEGLPSLRLEIGTLNAEHAEVRRRQGSAVAAVISGGGEDEGEGGEGGDDEKTGGEATFNPDGSPNFGNRPGTPFGSFSAPAAAQARRPTSSTSTTASIQLDSHLRASYAGRWRPARTYRGVAHAASASSLVIDAVESRRPSSAVYPPVTQRRGGRSLLSSSSSDGAGGSHAAQHAPRPFGAAAAAARKAREEEEAAARGTPAHTLALAPSPAPAAAPGESPVPPQPTSFPPRPPSSSASLSALSRRGGYGSSPSSGNLPTTLSASLGPQPSRGARQRLRSSQSAAGLLVRSRVVPPTPLPPALLIDPNEGLSTTIQAKVDRKDAMASKEAAVTAVTAVTARPEEGEEQGEASLGMAASLRGSATGQRSSRPALGTHKAPAYDGLQPIIGNGYRSMPSRVSAEAANETRRAAAMVATAARVGVAVDDEVAAALGSSASAARLSGQQRPSTPAGHAGRGGGAAGLRIDAGRGGGGGYGSSASLASSPSSPGPGALMMSGGAGRGSSPGSPESVRSPTTPGGYSQRRPSSSSLLPSTPPVSGLFGGGGTGALLSRRPSIAHTIALPKDTSRLPPKRGLPNAEELKALAGELRGGSLGSRSRLTRLREVFDAIDVDSSGSIDFGELEALFAHAGIPIDDDALQELMDSSEVALKDGQLEFIEFLEAIMHIGRRARAELRAREAGELVKAKKGQPTVLDRMLEESRRQAAEPPPCTLLEIHRHQNRIFYQSAPIITFQPTSVLAAPIHPVAAAHDDANDRGRAAEKHTTVQDSRGAVQLRKSALGEFFALAAHYAAALMLHAFCEPAAKPSIEGAVTPDNIVPLDLLTRQQAWARLSGFPDTPALSGAQFQQVLARWIQHIQAQKEHSPTVGLHNGVPCLIGVRRVHPSERTPQLSGWDVLQLLSFFKAGKLADVPFADANTLHALPLHQIWPTLGQTWQAPGGAKAASAAPAASSAPAAAASRDAEAEAPQQGGDQASASAAKGVSFAGADA